MHDAHRGVSARSSGTRGRVLLERDDRRGAGLGQQVADLGLAGAVADPDDGQPGALGRDERDVHPDAVGEQHRDAGLAGQPVPASVAASRVARASYSDHDIRASSTTNASASGCSPAHRAT